MMIPGDFQRFVTEVFDGGATWIAGLADLLQETAEQHGLILLPPFPLAYNFVDRKSTRLNSSHMSESRMPSSA